MKCIKCDTELRPDSGAPDDPVTYQFDNALWIGFFGGYGMFVDNLDAKLPINTADRWLTDAHGEYLVGTVCDCDIEDPGVELRYHAFTCPCRNPIEDPQWCPEYREERVLASQPDYEAVLCHDCAHALCDSEPWVKDLLNPHGSHAHRTDYHDAHPEHAGWDYDRN